MKNRTKGKPFRDGFVHVMSEKCATCIFRPGNLMQLEPGRVKEMVDASLERQTAIICHETLNGPGAVCAGFFERYQTQPLQIAEWLRLLKRV